MRWLRTYLLPARAATLSEDEGFADFAVPIRDVRFSSTANMIVTRGKLHGRTIGFAIELATNWTKRPVQNMDIAFSWGTGKIRRTGPESDAFVAVVASAYGLRANRGMVESIDAIVVCLGSDPARIRTDPVKTKFFLNSDSAGDEAEVFVNVDLRTRVVQFHEKDPHYRGPLVRALSGP